MSCDCSEVRFRGHECDCVSMTVLRCDCGGVASFSGEGPDPAAFCEVCLARYVQLSLEPLPSTMTFEDLLRRLGVQP